MNPYVVLASTTGSSEAMALGARLSEWHDAMVAHERVLRTGSRSAGCDDECPHAEASVLWNEALQAFGPRAHDLTFLRARAAASVRELAHSIAG